MQVWDMTGCLLQPASWRGAEWERNILVHGLESLEDKGVAGKGRFNGVGESYVNDVNEEGWRKESDSVVVIIRMREKVWVMGEGVRAY